MSNQRRISSLSSSMPASFNEGSITDTKHTLVIIDPFVDEPEKLANGVRDGIPVHILDAHRDGIQQITSLLQAFPKAVQRLHIISHGKPGTLYLGNGELSLTTFANYTQDLLTWFQNLETKPELLLYGCNVAAGDAGAEFLTKLHAITHANLAASTHKVGHAELGGSWHLDTQYGSPETELALNTWIQHSYPGVFAPVDLSAEVDVEAGGVDWNIEVEVGGDGFTVEEATLIDTSQGDTYDDALSFIIDGVTYDPDPNGDLTGTTVTGATASLSGLNVTGQYYFDENLPVVRAIAFLENPTNADITITFGLEGNLGSDSNTTISTTSSGDALVDTDDRWAISFEDSGSPDPVITHVLYGPDAEVATSTATLVDGDDDYLFEYSVTVPANSTRSLMFFNELTPTTADAATIATRYDDTATIAATTLLSGLTDEQLVSIVNWSFNVAPTVTEAVTATATENDAAFSVDLLSGASDLNGDMLSIGNLMLVSGDAAGVTTNGTTLNVDPDAYNTLLDGQSEVITYSYDIEDGNGNSASQTATITITGITDPTPFDDVLTGTAGRDVIFALAGNDSVQGLGGPDRLGGDEGNDVLLGGEGNDRLLGGDGNDNLIGGAGRDRSLGGTGNDRMVGGSGNDRMVGGSGEDTLLGGVGDDTLIGGADDDRLLGAGGNDLMRGNLGDDVLNGGAGNDIQFGGAGRDRLNGQGGNDVIRGGAGRDILRGGAGNDRLQGELGNDVIFGGAGRDRVVVFAGQGLDRFADFQDGLDRIVLPGISFGALSIQQQGNDVLISSASEDLLLLSNTNVGQISQADFA
ncbi:MAG: DUF4347 domain-containing protein [Cyanobacteria bacterium J06638_22]